MAQPTISGTATCTVRRGFAQNNYGFVFIASQSDYFNTEILFEACESRRCVNLEIVDDSINEGDETLYMTLNTTPNLTNMIELHRQVAELKIIIIDNNGKTCFQYLCFSEDRQ